MRPRRIQLAALGIFAATVAVLGLVLFLGSREVPSSEKSEDASSFSFDPRTARAHWEGRVKTLGSAGAWTELKQTYAKAGPGVQHTLAHLFGSILFEKNGLEGIAVCDAAFAYGCYHSFFGGALAAHGLDIVPSLVRDCHGSLGCEHGIGHGLMEFFGPGHFLEALEACPPETNPFRGCAAGVFMEYNVPMALDGDLSAPGPRRFDPAKPYDPCPQVPERFRAACYHELPAWWRQTYGLDEKVFREFCGEISLSSEREACLFGIPAF
jgi:hypothetical protein